MLKKKQLVLQIQRKNKSYSAAAWQWCVFEACLCKHTCEDGVCSVPLKVYRSINMTCPPTEPKMMCAGQLILFTVSIAGASALLQPSYPNYLCPIFFQVCTNAVFQTAYFCYNTSVRYTYCVMHAQCFPKSHTPAYRKWWHLVFLLLFPPLPFKGGLQTVYHTLSERMTQH